MTFPRTAVLPLLAAATFAPAQTSAPNTSLAPPPIRQHIDVTATRAPIAVEATANSIVTLTQKDLQSVPNFTLDDALRQRPGFELFRRASSWIANPTSEGISLRGLGSTAASRTLVLTSGVPLNDPFGGWIHWNEIPSLAIDSIELASGGGSDLYGSSAIGGVINVLPSIPKNKRFTLESSGAGLSTYRTQARADLAQRHTHELLSGSLFGTNGYIPLAANLRGPIDTPANVRYKTGRFFGDYNPTPTTHAFLLGNLLDERRNNGTTITRNWTRLWRYTSGLDTTAGPIALQGRAYGSAEGYAQTFSSINATRTIENLTRSQRVRIQELGASLQASTRLRSLLLLAGADTRDLRAGDLERPTNNNRPTSLQDLTARQRLTGAFVEALYEQGPWNLAASARIDHVGNFDARLQTTTLASGLKTLIPYADRGETLFNPRLGIVRRLGTNYTLRATAYRAFRAPTPNELYRTGQVGQEITTANPNLRSEIATGYEIGATAATTSRRFDLNAVYFDIGINRPVSAITTATTPTTINKLRVNLGSIRSRGTAIDAGINRGRPISLIVGYQFAQATVTNFSADTTLVGKLIPQVPEHAATAAIQLTNRRLGTLSLLNRYTSRAYDDASNAFPLHAYFRSDLSATHAFGSRFETFLTVQNLFARNIEVARTPLLTYGTPQLLEIGARFSIGKR